jgi:hypothetical protein
MVKKDKTYYYNNHFKKNLQFIVNDLALKIFKCQWNYFCITYKKKKKISMIFKK